MPDQPPNVELADNLTIIITTSPVPTSPSTELLTHVFNSFQVHCHLLLKCRVIVVFDNYERITERARHKRGAVTPQEGQSYTEYIANVKKLVLQTYNHDENANLDQSISEAEFGSPFNPANSVTIIQSASADQRVKFLEPTRCLGFSMAVRSALRAVSTPYVWVHQHDWSLVTPIPVESILNLMKARHSNERAPVRYICFPSLRLLKYEELADSLAYPAYRELTRELTRCSAVVDKEHVPLTPLFFWYDKPHIAATSHYLERVFPTRFATKRGDFIEDTFGQKVRIQIREDPKQWKKFATWLYYPGEGRTLCLRHLDGRVWRGEEAEIQAAEGWRAANRAKIEGRETTALNT